MTTRLDKKQQRKTLKNSAGPQCTPPNRACGDRCIPPNWECHTGINAAGPRGANSAYKSNVIGAAGNLEAAGRDVLALAKPGNRRNVFKTVDRVGKSLNKALVELTPYPKLDPKRTQGKTPEEIQAMEAQEYSRRLTRNYGLAIGTTLFSIGGVVAFANRARLARLGKTVMSRQRLVNEFAAAGGVEWGSRNPSPNSSFAKKIASILSGKNNFSTATTERFRTAPSVQDIYRSQIPYFSKGLTGGHTQVESTLQKRGVYSRLYERAEAGKGLTGAERALLKNARAEALKVAARPSSQPMKGYKYGAHPEEHAFNKMYEVMSSGGPENSELNEVIARDIYQQMLGTEIAASKTVSEALRTRYRTVKVGIEEQMRLNLSAKLGITPSPNSTSLWNQYRKMPDLDRLALFADDTSTGIDRIAKAQVTKEWADAFSKEGIDSLVARDITRTTEAVGVIRTKIRQDLKTPNAIYDTAAIDYMWGQRGLDLPAVRLEAVQDRINELVRQGKLTPEQAADRIKTESARLAMRDYLNRLRFEEKMPLDLMTREDLYQTAIDSRITLPANYLQGNTLKGSVTKNQLLAELEKALRGDAANGIPPRTIFYKNVAYQGNANTVYSRPPKPKAKAKPQTKQDSATFNWGADWKRCTTHYYRYDWGWEGRIDAQGKPCGKSYISRDKECGEGAGTPTTRSWSESALASIKEVAQEDRAAIVAGSAILGISAGAFAAAVLAHRRNLPNLALKAEQMAKTVDVPSRATTGLKHSEIYKGAESASDVLSATDADSLVFHINGFTGGNGTGGDSMMLQHSSGAPNSMHIALSNEEFNVPVELGEALGGGDRLKTAAGFSRNAVASLRQVIQRSLEPGGNPVSLKLAANIKAYRDKFPNKPIVVNAWSAGTMVAADTDQILRQMGIKDVSYVMFGPFHYGLAPKPPRSTYIVGKRDQLRFIPGMVSNADYTVDSDHFYNDASNKAVRKSLGWYTGAGKKRGDSTRLDKPCGKSFISNNEECGKQPAATAPTPSRTATTLKITGAVGGAGVAGALAHFYHQGFNETKLKPNEIPPKKPPAGLYDTFVPGDLIYHGVDFVGTKRAHYGVYMGKKGGRHIVMHTAAKPNPSGGKKPTVEMIISDMDTYPDTDPGRTSFVKAPRLSNTTPPPSQKELRRIFLQMKGKKVRYSIADLNCEHIARAIAGDLPRSTQMEKLTWLNRKLTQVINNFGVDNRFASIDLDDVKKVVKTVRRLDSQVPLVVALRDALEAASFIKDPVLAQETLVQAVSAILMAVLVSNDRLETPDAA